MPIIVPIAATSYADATNTEGGALGKYVIAQFRDDALLDWVSQLRSACSVDELKYANLKERRPILRKDTRLWSLIEKGIGQATIVIADPRPYFDSVKFDLDEQGAKEEIDYDFNDLIKGSSIALLNNTPIAYMPLEMMKLTGVAGTEVASFDSFSPVMIQSAVGDSLRSAKVVAARAHAIFDTPRVAEHISDLNATLRSPAATVLLAEILSTCRVFDDENPKSTNFLNIALDEMAESLAGKIPFFQRVGLVSEANSNSTDYLQAADIAAGLAREIIDTSGTQPLGDKFERVWINGKRLK